MSIPLRTQSALCCLLALGCEEAKERPTLAPAERSQVIQQKATTAQPATAVTTTTPPTPSAPKPRRALCGGKLDAEGKPAPKKPISRMSASGEPELTGDPTLSGGFTWVNFWAT
jgi:hypothetical protein